MVTRKSNKKENLGTDRLQMITKFMEICVATGKEPSSVSSFCMEIDIEESEFYKFFTSIGSLKQDIWVLMLENVKTNIDKEPAFDSFSNRDKLLSFYFSLFEVFALNRSYIVFAVDNYKSDMKNLTVLSPFKMQLQEYVSSLVKFNFIETNNDLISKFSMFFVGEGAWNEFLFLLKFWMGDTSKDFEKTEILIEKSITTIMSAIDNSFIQNFVDLNKFLLQDIKGK